LTAVHVLVLGSGVAGLTAARTAAEAGLSVTVLTKGELAASATRYAQGGVAAALSPNDSPELHFSDTLSAGGGLCDAEAVRVLVAEGPTRVRELIALGASFDPAGEGADFPLALAREGGHALARVVHAGGDAARLTDLRGRVDPDHIVVRADEVARPPDEMPFVASFCDIWLPAEAVISERSIRIITRELERRGVGVIMIHAPSGSVLVAMRTRVHRRVCNEVGLRPDAGPDPALVSAAVAAFGVWHMAASAAEITWSTRHGEPEQEAMDQLLDQGSGTI